MILFLLFLVIYHFNIPPLSVSFGFPESQQSIQQPTAPGNPECSAPTARTVPPKHTHGFSRARTRAPTRRQDPHNCLCQAGTQGVMCLRCKLLSPVLHLLLPLLPLGSLRAPGPAPGLGIRAKLSRRLCSEDASSLQVRAPSSRRGSRAPARVPRGPGCAEGSEFRAGGKLVRKEALRGYTSDTSEK